MMTGVGQLRMVETDALRGRQKETPMGLMFRPRRPLMRVAAGATTATVAYKAGQRRNQQGQSNEQAQAPQAAPAAPAPAPAAAPADSTAELERLAKLHESGALTDEEFAAAKSKVLGL
jgi:Short C-terminal domain